MRYFGKGAVSLFLATAFSLFIPSFVSAQQEEEQRDGDSNRGAQYFLGEQDELLIKVNIWGFVRKPGQYLVPKNTDLISLISFAGGPLEQAKIKKVKIIRDGETASSNTPSSSNGRFNQNETMLASRSDNLSLNKSSPQPQVIEVNIKKYIETGQQALIPELRPGDTIIVPGNTLHFLGKAMDFVSKFAVIAQVYFWIDIANRR
jgi:polysaccharide export outer membrane protein